MKWWQSRARLTELLFDRPPADDLRAISRDLREATTVAGFTSYICICICIGRRYWSGYQARVARSLYPVLLLRSSVSARLRVCRRIGVRGWSMVGGGISQ